MDDSKTCSTCKHWSPPEPSDAEFDVAKTFRNDYGVCGVAKSSEGKPEVPLQPSCAMDSSGYHAFLGTLPSFSCNRHEIKP